jgi:hypothetical protein
MLILMTAPAMLGRQSLAAGVLADVPDDAAQRLIASGVAKQAGVAPQTADQALDDAQDAPPTAPRRKKARTDT